MQMRCTLATAALLCLAVALRGSSALAQLRVVPEPGRSPVPCCIERARQDFGRGRGHTAQFQERPNETPITRYRIVFPRRSSFCRSSLG
jgi:hypothetical protein